MNILVVNAGSTTVKYTVLSHTGDEFNELISGILDARAEKITSKLKKNGEEHKWEISIEEFRNAPDLILKELGDLQIGKIGMRIVHGGETYIRPTELSLDVLADLAQHNELAPLHNPFALNTAAQLKQLLPDTPMFGVFDTAFHATIPAKAHLYAIPYEFYKKYGVRRFGFHGISHKYVSQHFAKLEPDAKKVISCHLGGGASIAAIADGKSIDTSMGFTPLEGLIMATRPGDIDDGAIHYLMDKMHMSVKDMQIIENYRSGLLGISGETSDMRKLLEMEAQGHERAQLAIEMYIYRIQKYIGQYAASLQGVDGLIFTAGVGAGSDVIRSRIIEGLQHLNLELDEKLNNGQVNVSQDLKISKDTSAAIWVVPTNEEQQIASEIIQL